MEMGVLFLLQSTCNNIPKTALKIKTVKRQSKTL